MAKIFSPPYSGQNSFLQYCQDKTDTTVHSTGADYKCKGTVPIPEKHITGGEVSNNLKGSLLGTKMPAGHIE